MANKTDIQEASQALFCALADFAGASAVDKWFDVSKYKTYSDFKENWNKKYKQATIEKTFSKQVKSGKATLIEIEKLLNGEGEKSKKDSWYISSTLIANKLIKDINKISNKFNKIRSPSWSSIFYSHGDEDIMDLVAQLYKKANNQQKLLYSADKGSTKKVERNFDNINKWSTADIYLASDLAKRKLTELSKIKVFTFMDLNTEIGKLIDAGELLPLSLKKSENNVIIKKVNFIKDDEQKLIESMLYAGISDWKPYRPSLDGSKTEARTLIIYMTKDKKLTLQIRHDPSTVVFKGIVTYSGAGFFEGSLTINPMIELLQLIDATFANKWEKSYADCNEKYVKKKEYLDKEIKQKDRKKYDIERTMASAMLVTNIMNPMLIDWLNSNKRKANKFMQLVFMFATARSENSSKYVIAKEG